MRGGPRGPPGWGPGRPPFDPNYGPPGMGPPGMVRLGETNRYAML